VTVRTLLGLNVALPVGTLTGDGTWQPTPTYVISLENFLSTLQLFAQPKATFHFTALSGRLPDRRRLRRPVALPLLLI
jgi:hypothetical protein